MSNKKQQWHSLGDFLQAKEERERAQGESEAAESTALNVGTGVSTPVPTPVLTPVVTPVSTGAPSESTGQGFSALPGNSLPEIKSEWENKDKQPYLDATHSASEQRIYSVMYRETLSKGQKERHFGFKELCVKTGIRSDRTIRRALDGLQEKLSVEIVSYFHGNPLGPRYRIYDPKEILKRRRAAGIEIDPQSKRIIDTGVGTGVSTGVGTGVQTAVTTGGKNYGSAPVKTTPVTPVESTGVDKYRNSSKVTSHSGAASSSNQYLRADDDEALAAFNSALKQAAKQITGKEPAPGEAERWKELADVLVTELKIAAGRTSVSSVPSFLAEHLRRRLFKKDRAQLASEEKSGQEPAVNVDASKCPDCYGTGMWYPGGYEKGVARCCHEKLSEGK